MRHLAVVSRLRVCAAALLFSCAAAAAPDAPSRAGTVTLVTLAVDVPAVVLRDGAGHLERYAPGARIGASAWTVRRIGAAGATLSLAAGLAGHAYEVHLAAGASLDLDAAAAARDALSAPQPVPAGVSVGAAPARPAARPAPHR